MDNTNGSSSTNVESVKVTKSLVLTEHNQIGKTTMETTVNQDYLFEGYIPLLGIQFLKNVSTEVHNAMNNILLEVTNSTNKNGQQENEAEKTTKSFDLPLFMIKIRNSPTKEVEIILNQDHKTKFTELCKSLQINHKEPSQVENEMNVEEYLLQLVAKPIIIPCDQLFLYRGKLESLTERCLALTTNNTVLMDSLKQDVNLKSSLIRHHLCMVLYAESPAEVTDIVEVFRKHTKPSSSIGMNMVTNQHQSRSTDFKVIMVAGVEIQEEVSEGKWHTAPIDKEGFKLRTNLDKRICITLHQDLTHHSFTQIRVERCFGMLLCPGRNMVSSDMVAIGLQSLSTSMLNNLSTTAISIQNQPQQPQWQIVASWVPSELNFEYLNTETPRDTRVYFTIAVDLVIEQIDEPVRFIFETKAKIVAPTNSVAATATEKFWQNFASYKITKQLNEQFHLIIRQQAQEANVEIKSKNQIKYEVISCLSSTQIAQQKQRLSLQLNRDRMLQNSSGEVQSPSEMSSLETPTVDEVDDDDDEPLASGTGSVSQECSQSELESWKDILDKWTINLDVRPKQLARLVRRGVPEALRPAVWQYLSGSHYDEEMMMQKYRTLVSKESSFEAIIQRDINRTFPAHEMFRAAGGQGQESLFRICKAYSNFDEEIGYCQGLSFLVAALLLHMPEEQAFCVFVRIMYNYGLRNLYRCGLEDLHCKFFQLDRFLDDHLPELYLHFADLHVETHMYASQWFLTLFTTKFPLNAVFLIIDLFLLDQMDTLLQIAIALLKLSKNDLLVLDFEGVMKYFRVSLPKKYRTDNNAHQLIRTAVKINVKKSKKYEKDYRAWLERNKKEFNPLEHLEAEKKRLMLTCIRLEQENDDLSQELLSTCKSKIKLQSALDVAEDKAETLNGLLLNTRSQMVDVEEEKSRLLEEAKNLKEMCRKQNDTFETENRNNRKIIEEYKQICKNYQSKFEAECERSIREMELIKEKLKSCDNCANYIAELTEKNGVNDNVNLTDPESIEASKYKDSLLQKITDLESELIRTKVRLAESEDRNGLLAGRLHTTNSELNLMKAQAEEAAQNRSNTWFTKTLTTLRDATKVKQSNSISYGISSTTNSLDSPTSLHESINNHESLHNHQQLLSLQQPQQQSQQGSGRRYSSRDIFQQQQQP